MPHIDSFLSNIKSRSFHMPGHKRNANMFPNLPLDKDITEIEGADNLHLPTGIIKNAMEDAAVLWGAKRSYFLVNGSTCGILAGLAALTKRGDKVLVARNCHRSVFHGIELLGLNPVYVLPEYLPNLGTYGALLPSAVEAAIEGNADITTLVVTSPSYEGIISDLDEICRLCHQREITVLTDEAHGAHLGLSPYFTGGSVAAGADISVQSLHKTLTALTQTAILHVNSDRVDIPRLEHKLRVFETSSPSYLLMQSAEHSVEAAKKEELFKSWAELIDGFEEKIYGLKHIKLMRYGERQDRSKLVFTGVNGKTLGSFLRERRIEPELVTDTHLIAMTGMGNTEEDYTALAAALAEADALLPPTSPASYITAPPFCHGNAVLGIEEALEKGFELVPPDACIGRIAAEYVWAYPPGIPLLIPGEPITAEFASAKLEYLESDSGLLPKAIRVICENAIDTSGCL